MEAFTGSSPHVQIVVYWPCMLLSCCTRHTTYTSNFSSSAVPHYICLACCHQAVPGTQPTPAVTALQLMCSSSVCISTSLPCRHHQQGWAMVSLVSNSHSASPPHLLKHPMLPLPSRMLSTLAVSLHSGDSWVSSALCECLTCLTLLPINVGRYAQQFTYVYLFHE